MGRKKKQQKVYSFKVPSLFKGLDPTDAANELERIRGIYGDLKPEYVVTESEDSNSLLHNYFEWDDTVAANKFRKEQAKLLIRSITVEVVTQNINCNVRAFVNVVESGKDYRNYVPIDLVLKDTDAYNDLLAQAKDEMGDFVRKYNDIVELDDVRIAMQRTLSKLP